jgi:hypothetical protein
MLNLIIRLQAVVKIITNETTRALNLLVKQNTNTHSAIYHNHLALEYFIKNFKDGVFNTLIGTMDLILKTCPALFH